ncbi:MAG: Sensor histidine kinase RcsC [Ignavibacteriaceae bacterium]|nr:Sensor histidine kinase RcsC [Ignavibacteriaceae bacterium]
MSSAELKNLFKDEPELNTGYSRIYLYLLFGAMIALPVFGYLLKNTNPGAADNLWERFALAGLGLIAIAIYKSPPHISRYFDPFLQFMFYLVSIWSLRVTANNNFSMDYVTGHLVVISAVVLGYYKPTARRIYMAVMTGLTALWMIFTPDPATSGDILVSNMVVMFVIFDLVFNNLRSMFTALRFRNKVMGTLYHESTDALIILSMKTGKIENCNEQALSLFGVRSPAELEALNLLSQIPQELLSFSPGLTTEKGMLHAECRIPKSGGEMFWASVAVRNIYSDTISFSLIRIVDITARKQKEDAVKASEEWLRKLIENSSDVITLLDSGARVIFNSAAFARFTGFSENEFTTSPFTDLIVPEDALRVKEMLDRVMDYEVVKDEEFRLITASGGYIWIECSFTNRLKDPVVKSIILNFRDITERRLATAMIAESETRYRSLFDSSPVGILLYDKNLTVISANKKFCEITKIPPQKITSLSLHTLEDQKVLTVISNTLKGIEGEYEGLYTSVNSGARFFMKLQTTPLREANGSVAAGIAIVEDITQKVQAEQDLVKAKAHAEQISRLKSAFLTNMSHELRTPMNGILGFAQIIREEASSPEQKEMSESIIKSGVRLMTTLNSILDLALLESGEVVVNKKRIVLQDIVRMVTDKYYDIALDQGLSLSMSAGSDILDVLADEKLLSQAISHLLDNAIKFTKSGGVEISLEVVSASRAAIYIKDTGMGIPQEHLELIFQDFRQVSEGYSRHFEGTGLGLSIVQRMLALIDCEIEAESVVGQGTTFIIKLPLLSVEEANDHDEKQEAGEDNSGKLKILLVEDNMINAEIVNRALRNQYLIDTAKTGSEAVKLVRKRNYELVLMDIHLGMGMNGIDVKEEIRRLPEYETVPIIAITGYVGEHEREILLTGGFDFFLSKPFKKDQLLEIVAAARKSREEKKKHN